jgi:5,10-methylenetetrahydromethanopterin reductase
MGEIQFWNMTVSMPGTAARAAERAEAQGWNGLTFTDSQHLAGDPYSALCLAAKATANLELATGVTHPGTRHPAATASAIATVQVESGGRAVLGIGRGDSALALLGRRPVPVAAFQDYLVRVQAYLRGEEVEENGHRAGLRWLGDQPKVPVDVAATGPRVTALAARLAERLTFAVGASAERLASSIRLARRAREEARLDPDGLDIGAYLNVVPHADRSRAREVARGGVATFAHFSSLPGARTEDLPREQRAVVEQVGRQYELAKHGDRTGRHARLLSDEFIDDFAIVGPSEECAERLRKLVALGLRRIVVNGGSRGADPILMLEAAQRFADEVIPQVRDGA